MLCISQAFSTHCWNIIFLPKFFQCGKIPTNQLRHILRNQHNCHHSITHLPYIHQITQLLSHQKQSHQLHVNFKTTITYISLHPEHPRVIYFSSHLLQPTHRKPLRTSSHYHISYLHFTPRNVNLTSSHIASYVPIFYHDVLHLPYQGR